MANNPRCGWVRDHLPLLDGGELTGPDRRAVERHLLACPDCRARRASLAQTLAVLHAAGDEDPWPGASGRPLWPDLERQIRESRRPRPSLLPGWWALLARPTLGLGVGLALLAALGWAAIRPRPEAGPMVATPAEPSPVEPARATIVAREEPVSAPAEAAPSTRFEAEPAPALAPTPRGETQNTY